MKVFCNVSLTIVDGISNSQGLDPGKINAHAYFYICEYYLSQQDK